MSIETFSYFEWETRLPFGSDELVRPLFLYACVKTARYFGKTQEETFVYERVAWTIMCLVLGVRGNKQPLIMIAAYVYRILPVGLVFSALCELFIDSS